MENQKHSGGVVSNKIERIYPLTTMQEGMLYHKLLDSGSDGYVLQDVFRIQGNLNTDKLRSSFRLLLNKYDVLRTMIFYSKTSEPKQVVLTKREEDFKVIDLSEHDKNILEDKVSSLKAQDIRRGFDFEKDCLIRLTIIKNNELDYYLLWTAHHIILDGWCTALLFGDLIKYYKFLTGGTSMDEAKALIQEEKKEIIPYEDYVKWIRKQNHQESLNYWKHLLKDFDHASTIQPIGAAERTKEQVRSVNTRMGETETKSLQEFSMRHQLTVSTIVETAWGILLQRYNGVQDVVFGKVVSGRNIDLPDIEQAVGLFINTVPTRIKSENSETCLELLQRMQEQAMESMKHEYCSLADIQKLNKAGSGLIHSLYIFENYYVNEAAQSIIDGLQIDAIDSREQTDYPLSLYAGMDKELSLHMLYNPSEYPEVQINQLLSRLKAIINYLVHMEQESVGSIQFMEEHENQTVLTEFNQTEAAEDVHRVYIELFEEQVRKTPDSAALVFEEHSLTYDQLNKKANQLAYKLKKQGMKQGDMAAILSDRSDYMIFAMLGVLKAGGGYIPIEPSLPQERIQYMKEDAGCKFTLLYEQKNSMIDCHECLIHLESADSYDEEESNPDICNIPEDVCYTIYTSGSTGVPKGVMIQHSNVVNYCIQSRCGIYGGVITEGLQRFVSVTNFSFDIFVTETLLSLANGLTIILTNETEQEDPKKFAALILRQDVEILQTTPSRLKLYLMDGNYGFLRNLKLILLGGEKFDESLLPIIRENSQAVIANVYGPTETTVWSAYYVVPEGKDKNIPIGKPITNTQIYIMDNGNLCPVGIPGELCIAGEGVAKGYCNKEEITRKQFIDNPFGNGRLYRTGDLGRWLPDGNLEHLGRIDEQVKIRGYRIELGEIEAVLVRVGKLKNAAVAAKKNSRGETCLNGYIISDKAVDLNALKELARKELPDYMVPSAIMQMSEFPLSNNGKINKKALPDIELVREQEYIAPRNETEEKLQNIVSKILEVAKVGIKDNFFDMGGHSIKATKAANQIEAAFGIRIPLKALFQNPTIEEIGRILDREQTAQCFDILPAERKDFYAMSPAQQRIYIIYQMDPEERVYNMWSGMDAYGEFEPERAKEVLVRMTERHEILRTSFSMIDGRAVQIINPEPVVDFVYEQKEELTKSEKEDLLFDFVRPFELDKAPLFRMKVIKYGDKDHLLFFDMHHIISDGTTVNLMIQEFIDTYNGKQAEGIPIQYKDYSEWMFQRDLSAQKEYWIKQFQDSVPILDFPLDYSRKQIRSYEGGRAYHKVPKKIKEDILELCSRTKSTEYMVLLSAYFILLGKYSRQEHIIVGSPISGRTHKDTEQMWGMFVNTLAISGRFEGDMSYIKMLEGIKATCLQAYDNQEYPFEQLLEDIEVNRDLARNPLFDVLFTLNNKETQTAQADRVEFIQLVPSQSEAKFDLSLELTDEGDEYSVCMEYCVDLFKEETIHGILEHYLVILKEICRNPQLTIGEIAMITEQERQWILNEFNATETLYPSYHSVIEAFEEQVQRQPENKAIIWKGSYLTYDELNQRVNCVAHKLRKLGVGRNSTVVIIMERSIEMVIGIYGILKAGGAYVPVAPDYPLDRMEYIITDCSPKVCLVRDQLLKEQLSVKVPILDLTGTALFSDEISSNPCGINKAEDLAYIIYTSGTTGQPKGVMCRQDGLLNRIQWMQEQYPIDKEDTILQKTTYTFDVSVWEFLWWGMTGAKLALLPLGDEMEPHAIVDAIYQNQITVMHFVPSMLNMFLLHMESNGQDIRKLDSLRYIFSSGEALKPESLKRFNKLIRHYSDKTRLVNLYGPTEASIDVTYFNCEYDYSKVPIGKPIANIQIYIMNGNHLCGIGVAGELCISGVGIAEGYLNQEGLTKEKFVQNPFGKGNMYRTGDLARWMPNGEIEYFGRIDNQVKIRGLRIELEEIERVICRASGVQDAAVIIREEVKDDPYICAYYTGDPTEPEEIKNILRKKLPQYMIPQHIVKLDSIPVTKNGKLDIRALPYVEVQGNNIYMEPQTEIEKELLAIFARILGSSKFGVEDDFFELGGHSLRAVKLMNEIEKVYGAALPLKTVFLHRTVRALGELLEKHHRQPQMSIQEAAIKECYPMSSSQQRMYVLQEMDEGGTAYNISMGLQSEEPLHNEQVRNALIQLTKRHEILRTSFHMEGSHTVQRVSQDVLIDYTYEESEALTEKEKEHYLEQFIQPFQLDQAPLLRLKNVNCGNYNLLLFDIHHIISDGISLNIIMEEFTVYYHNGTLPVPRVQYKDYSEWMQSRDLSAQREYWNRQFEDDIPVLELPFDYSRRPKQNLPGNTIFYKLNYNMKHKINHLCSETETTEFMVLIAVFMMLLSKYSRQEDIAVGIPVSKRVHRDTEGMLGMFVNTLVLRGKPEHKKNFYDFLEEVKELCLGAYDNQEYPFEQLVEDLGITRDTTRNPLFDVMFSLQIAGESRGNNTSSFKQIEVHNNTSKFDLTLDVVSTRTGYELSVEYRSDLFTQANMELFLQHYKVLLDHTVRNPSLPLYCLQVIDKREREQLLCEFNHTDTAYEQHMTVPEIFERQVEKTPDKIALICDNEKLTYRELNEKVNQAANQLRSYGIKKDDFVVVMSEPSMEEIIGILAVIKAGGAYVPIDASYPIDRIRYMIEDCGAKIVLSGNAELEFDAGIPVIELSDEKLYGGSNSNPEIINHSDDLMYVIYTSGTTGKPKGTMIEHRGINNVVSAYTKLYGMQADDIILQFASISFDQSVWDIFVSLLTGAALCLVPEYIKGDMTAFKRYLNEQKVSIAALTPAFINELDPKDYPLLKVLESGGAAANPEALGKWLKGRRIFNTYGPTEVTINAITYECQTISEKHPIGKPIDNTKVYIVTQGELCGIGVPGELCLAGAGVARGYLNKEELTKEKFIRNPYGEGKLYLTGDLARWLPDGTIEYMGRMDEQVKIRGFRIELGEIESVLRKIDMIQDAVLSIKEDPMGDPALNGYIVSAGQVDISEIKRRLRDELPDYMIPSFIMQIDSIPVTKNGKVDKKALPAIDIILDKEIIKPRTEKEKVLASVFCGIFGIRAIGMKDNFYELGGDSIKAIRMISKLKEAGYELKLRDLMKLPVIEDMALKLQEMHDTMSYSQTELHGAVLQTPIQMEFFASNYMRPEHYNQSVMISSKEPLVIESVKIALGAIVKHHDILRMVYRDGSQVILSIREHPMYELYSYEWQDYSEEEALKDAIERKCTSVQESLNLETGPLLKAVLFHTDGADYLLLCVHHLLVDGISWRILLEDFTIAYRQSRKQEEIILPAKTASYQLWAEALQEYAGSGKLRNELEYWKKTSVQLRECKLKIEHKSSTIKTNVQTVSLVMNKTKTAYLEFDQETTADLLLNSGRAYKTEINDMLLSALGMAVQKLTGQEQIAVELEGHGREEIHRSVDISRTVGWFTTVYPIILTSGDTYERTLIDTKEMLRRIPSHGIGYGVLKYLTSELPVKERADICFNYLGDFDQEIQEDQGITLSDYPTGKEISEENAVSYMLEINSLIGDGKLSMTIIYQEDAMTETQIALFCKSYRESLTELIKHCVQKKERVNTVSDYTSLDISQDTINELESLFN